MRRIFLGALAGGLALVAAAASGVYWYERPTILRVGVARDTEDQKVMVATAQILARDRENVRLRVIGLDNPNSAAAAFEAGQVDLAVTRSDINMPKSAETVAILSRNPALILSPAGSNIVGVNDLKGKRIAVIVPRPEAPANARLLEYILSRYNLAGDATTRLPMTLGEAPAALANKRVDAVFAVGPPGPGPLTDAVAVVSAASEGTVNFIPLSESRAIAILSPTLESFDVARGAFGGAPPRPARDMTTISVSTRLVTRGSLRDSIVADIARVMFTQRPAIAATAPSANLMEAPPTDKDAALPTHPGAAAWIDGEEETFLDRYGDYFYIGAMVLSVIASAIAALASRVSAEGHARVESMFESLLGRLLEYISRARESQSPAELEVLEREADALLGEALRIGGGRGLDTHRVAALGLGLDQLRDAIMARRLTMDAAPRGDGAP